MLALALFIIDSDFSECANNISVATNGRMVGGAPVGMSSKASQMLSWMGWGFSKI